LRRFSVLALAALVLTFGMFLLRGSEARAQDAKPVHFGVTAGLNMAKMAYDPDIKLDAGEERNMRTAFRFGGEAEYAVSPMISVGSGLIYSMKGEKGSYKMGSVTVESTSKFSYLTIPVAVRINLGSSTGPKPFLKLGPELGILLSAKSTVEGTAGSVGASSDVDIKKFFNSTDLALLGGAGVELPLGDALKGVAEVGYELGLTDIGKDESEAKADESDATIKTRNIFLAVGVRF
jgi:opacity protein-like surface antigen